MNSVRSRLMGRNGSILDFVMMVYVEDGLDSEVVRRLNVEVKELMRVDFEDPD